jgi:myo-inositol-1(or 4)-monophosphatase
MVVAMTRRSLAEPALTELLRIAKRAVRQVGREVRDAARRSGRGLRRKAVGDFVTDVDVRAERRLRSMLRQAHPTAGFLGEEGGAEAVGREFVWVADPIDGTSNFARGLPCFAVALACLRRHTPIAAAMWCEPERRLYWAAAGMGAFREGTRLRLERPRTRDAAILGCQWHRGQARMAFLARLQRDGARIRTLGSTVVQLCDVAAGRLDGNVQQQGHIWDLAAPGLLVVEAGARLTDWRGRAVLPFARLEAGHVSTVCAAPGMHRRLLDLLAGAPGHSP